MQFDGVYGNIVVVIVWDKKRFVVCIEEFCFFCDCNQIDGLSFSIVSFVVFGFFYFVKVVCYYMEFVSQEWCDKGEVVGVGQKVMYEKNIWFFFIVLVEIVDWIFVCIGVVFFVFLYYCVLELGRCFQIQIGCVIDLQYVVF